MLESTTVKTPASGRIFLHPYAGRGGRNYFRQIGTRSDVKASDTKLEDGMVLRFYCDDADVSGNPDDLYFEGTVHFDAEKQCWYAVIDEASYHHQSDEKCDQTRPDAQS